MSASMNGVASALVAQLAAARLRQVPLSGGVSVQMDTPSQFAAHQLVEAMQRGDGDAAISLLVGLARNWAGVTQAALLGQGVGNDEPAPYAPELLRVWLADRPLDLFALAEAAAQQARQAREKADGEEKN